MAGLVVNGIRRVVALVLMTGRAGCLVVAQASDTTVTVIVLLMIHFSYKTLHRWRKQTLVHVS